IRPSSSRRTLSSQLRCFLLLRAIGGSTFLRRRSAQRSPACKDGPPPLFSARKRRISSELLLQRAHFGISSGSGPGLKLFAAFALSWLWRCLSLLRWPHSLAPESSYSTRELATAFGLRGKRGFSQML